MRSILAVLAVALLAATPAPLAYPTAPRGAVTDTYFGTTVADPYRWLESIDAPDTVAWVTAENALSRSYLDALPARPAIAAAYRKLYNYEKIGAPFRQGPRWFFTHNTGLQTQNVFFVRDSEFGPAREFFDPNTLSPDGSVQVAQTSFSPDGSRVAYATQSGGADWLTWHVKRIPGGTDTADVIRWSKFSDATWVGNTGFYYAGYDAPSSGGVMAALGAHKVWFHRLGTAQSADRLVFASSSHPDEFVGTSTTDDNRLLFFFRSKGNGNSLAWKRTAEAGKTFRPVFDLDPNVEYDVLGNDGTRVYLRTNRDAPRFRIVAIELTDPAHRLTDIVPQGPDKLEDAELVGTSVYASYLHDAHAQLERIGLRGGRTMLPLPAIGSVFFAPVHRNDRAVYYRFTSFAYPTSVVRYDTASRATRITVHSAIAFDPAPFVTEQLFATSKDGTRVPLFVTHRRDMPLDGTTPTILYGYGGFDISEVPYFSSARALWLQLGGAYASVTLRGGGEYGESWHEAGRLTRKQHVFDDFIAAAQLLIDRKITSTPKLAIDGGSNGGLLVGAALTQRPDLFGAAVAEQGVLDMLRYQRFTVGKAWIPEYGDANASADLFRALYAYSPVHNVRDGTRYPPTLVMTADHDDRVFPAHSFKFVAALQHAQAANAPILLRVETNEGHFAGLTTDKAIALTSDFYAFLAQSLNFTPALPPVP